MAITAIATGESSDHLSKPTVPPSSLVASPPARDLKTDAIDAAGAVTPTTAAPVVGTTGSFSGTVTLTAAASKIVPGATSFSVRNHADGADNLKVLDNGNTTIGGELILSTAAGKIVPGATSIAIRNNADAADNFKVLDNGNTSVGGTLTVTGAITATGGIAAPGTDSTVFHSGGVAPTTTTTGNDTTPVNTETYLVEVRIPANVTLTGVSILNGSAVAGNVTVGLFTSAGAVIAAAKSASTAQSGTAAYQQIPFAVAYAATMGKYFIGVQFDTNTTPRFRSHILGNFGAAKKTGETYGTFTAITPPTTFTTNLGPICDVY